MNNHIRIDAVLVLATISVMVMLLTLLGEPHVAKLLEWVVGG